MGKSDNKKILECKKIKEDGGNQARNVTINFKYNPISRYANTIIKKTIGKIKIAVWQKPNAQISFF
jgi:hypothetical protein